MTDSKNNLVQISGQWNFNRRQFLKQTTLAGLLTIVPVRKVLSNQSNRMILKPRPPKDYPDWIVEARIYGLSIYGIRVDIGQMKFELDRAKQQGANVIQANSDLAAYRPEKDFNAELDLISEVTTLIHDAGLKVVWTIPNLESITPYGRIRKDSFAKLHPDWIQHSFDGKHRAVFYEEKIHGEEINDEYAWMCPNSPYREWFKARLQRIIQTGVDGIWIDTTQFSPVIARWGCGDQYCRDTFTQQTGFGFPHKADVSDRAFWRFVQWRHETLTEFVDECREAVSSINPETVTIADVSTSDHLGATQYGTEGSSMVNNFVVWDVEPISNTTAMAMAGYEDWLILHGMYKYCRGATSDRPSWAFCYGYDDDDAQLVMASAVAAQNNPYELRVPEMTSTVGMEFRGMMYRWIAGHSKQIFRSTSIAPVAILYSERNRDFLDAHYSGGVFTGTVPPGRDQHWRANKAESPVNMNYMGDYRGLSFLLFQHQIPTDIHPMSRINSDTLQKYKVLILPYMAILTQNEKEMLLQAVHNGTTLIVSGPNPGQWDANGKRWAKSIWGNLAADVKNEHTTHLLGKGRLCFWNKLIGRDYLRCRDKKNASLVLSWIKQAGVESWVRKQVPVIVQPYVFEDQIILHILNYSRVTGMTKQSERLVFELSIPWNSDNQIGKIVQSEPQWSKPQTLDYLEKRNKLYIPIEVGRNAILIIDMK